MQSTCEWTDEHETGCWATSCDDMFRLMAGSPSANRMWFCCFCGGRIVEGDPDDKLVRN